MPLPESVRADVEATLAQRGLGHRIEAAIPVGGGCINHGARIDTDHGSSYFLKWNAKADPLMFAAEADGLEALRAASDFIVPQPIAWAAPGQGAAAWLLMDFIATGVPSDHSAALMGTRLAAQHSASRGEGFGWKTDNWIGSLPQTNGRESSWGVFWRDHRLAPYLMAARARGFLREEAFGRVLELTPSALSEAVEPALLHGDLWSGNTFVDANGDPVVIDPAVYEGHGEVDLAMTELFGGFGSRFYDAYWAEAGAAPGYQAYRRDLYQLCYLLVHVVLFGGSYEAASRAAAQRVLAALQ